MTEGDFQLRQAYGHEPFFKRAQRLAVAKARDPIRRVKIAAVRRGKPRPRHVIRALRQANVGRSLSSEHRKKLSLAATVQRPRGQRGTLRWSANGRPVMPIDTWATSPATFVPGNPDY